MVGTVPFAVIGLISTGFGVLNLGLKAHLKALSAVSALVAAPHWGVSLHYVWFSWRLREQGRGKMLSLTFLMRQDENTLQAPGTLVFQEMKL